MELKKWKFWNKQPCVEYVPRPDDKKWGDRFLGSDKGTELFSYATQTGISTALVSFLLPEALKDLREAGYHFRHATHTVRDMAIGTPGERGVKTLEEAIKQVKTAAAQNETAARELEEYQTARKKFVVEVSQTYRENETVIREAERLGVQLKGMTKNLFEVGNEVKVQWWKDNIDRPIIVQQKKWFGGKEYDGLTDEQILTRALEDSSRLKEFYQNARHFYDAREKNEATINQFCNYLAKVKDTSMEQNKKIESQFPKLVARLKEGYTVEDRVFEVDEKGTSMKQSDVSDVATKTADYKGKVDTTRTEVGQAVPLPKYSELNWVDVATNPLFISLLAVGAANAYLRLVPGLNLLYNPIQRLIGAPAQWTTKKLLNGASYVKDKVIPYKGG